MKVIRGDQHTFQQGETFTGDVTLEHVVSSEDGGMALSIVHFKDGARTNWHEHPGEQILYILEGEGRVGNSEEEYRVHPGDVVRDGPGNRHWHGAAPGKSMTHISITTGGGPTWYEAPEE